MILLLNWESGIHHRAVTTMLLLDVLLLLSCFESLWENERESESASSP